MHRICYYSAARQRAEETPWTGVADHSTLDVLQGTTDTSTSSLKPPIRTYVRVRIPPRAHIYQDKCASR